MTKRNEVAIYLDMDGVFVDFVKGAYKVFDDFELIAGIHSDMIKTPEQKSLRSELVKNIKKDDNFWEDLEWIKDGKKLFSFISGNFEHEKLAVLTAPINEDLDRCVTQKYNWIQKNFKNIIPRDRFFASHDKYKYVDKLNGKYQILIDDKKSNIDNWILNGGIGILHDSNNSQLTIESLKQFL